MTLLELPQAGRYGAIYADPPWAFETYSGGKPPQRMAVAHYPVMRTEDLAQMPVAKIAGKDAALFMWVVDAHLPQALELGEAWGFTFKTVAFVWHKMSTGGLAHVGLGYWTRSQGEICLLFTRGRPKRRDKGVRQFINAAVREHSRKPDVTHERIERLVGGPYLELFARERRPGWDAWGNEVGKFK